MNKENTETPSRTRTDWDRLEAMTDEEIDYSDIPALDDSFFQRARLYVPEHREIILDKDVFAWFVKKGTGYQTAINNILRRYIMQQKRTAS